MENIPLEITERVCGFLDTNDVISLSLTNKNFFQAITNNHFFWKQHIIDRYRIELPCLDYFSIMHSEYSFRHIACELSRMSRNAFNSLVVDMNSDIQRSIFIYLVPSEKVHNLGLVSNNMETYPWVDIKRFIFLRKLYIGGGHDMSALLSDDNIFPNISNIKSLYINFRSGSCCNTTLLHRSFSSAVSTVQSLQHLTMKNYFYNFADQDSYFLERNHTQFRRILHSLRRITDHDSIVELKKFAFVGPHSRFASSVIGSTIQYRCPHLKELCFDTGSYINMSQSKPLNKMVTTSVFSNSIETVSCITRLPPSHFKKKSLNCINNLYLNLWMVNKNVSFVRLAPSLISTSFIENEDGLKMIFRHLIRFSKLKTILYHDTEKEYAMPPEWRCFWLAQLLRSLEKSLVATGESHGFVSWSSKTRHYIDLRVAWTKACINIFIGPNKDSCDVRVAQIQRRCHKLNYAAHRCKKSCPPQCMAEHMECFEIVKACANTFK